MESALEEIEFLALSPNRVEVLRELAQGRRTRATLESETGASQATLGRILEDFTDRSWVRKEGSEYVSTATGRLVAEGFTDLLEILDTEGELRPIVRYLPTHAMDFDLRRLADARITVPSETRPTAPVQRVLDLIRDAEDVRVFSHAFNEGSLSVITDRVAAGDQSFKGVFPEHALDALAADETLQDRFSRLVETDGAAVRSRSEGIPLAVTIADETVHMLLRDENDVLQAALDTDDDAVRAWAHDTFDHYWRSGNPIEPDTLPD
jgi:predicted transcriptional regulator